MLPEKQNIFLRPSAPSMGVGRLQLVVKFRPFQNESHMFRILLTRLLSPHGGSLPLSSINPPTVNRILNMRNVKSALIAIFVLSFSWISVSAQEKDDKPTIEIKTFETPSI